MNNTDVSRRQKAVGGRRRHKTPDGRTQKECGKCHIKAGGATQQKAIAGGRKKKCRKQKDSG